MPRLPPPPTQPQTLHVRYSNAAISLSLLPSSTLLSFHHLVYDVISQVQNSKTQPDESSLKSKSYTTATSTTSSPGSEFPSVSSPAQIMLGLRLSGGKGWKVLEDEDLSKSLSDVGIVEGSVIGLKVLNGEEIKDRPRGDKLFDVSVPVENEE